jgi:probable HAF family extracellular repeat protein
MKSQSAFRSLIAFAAFAFFALSLPAQAPSQHTRYRLVQIGTFGGPNSAYNGGTPIATNGGTVVGAANTSTPDPYSPDCFDGTCLVQHAWKWHDGVLTDLGALPVGESSFALSLNSRGLVVGYARDGELDPLTGAVRFVATIWDHGQIKSLGTLGGGFSFALGATNQNFVMGLSDNGVIDTSGFPGFDGISEVRTFGWHDGTMFDLGTLGGTGAWPATMNNHAQVVGFSPTSPVPAPFGLQIDAFLWSGGKMQDLGTLGGTFGAANAINDRGQVVGFSNVTGDVAVHAFLWENGAMTDLGTIGGTFANANWLNDTGEIIGDSTTTGDIELHAFLWRHGVITDLGTVGTDNASNAFGINNKGQVVGQSWFYDGHKLTASHAFLWEDEGPVVDLNTLIVNPTDLYLTEANFITDRGWIIANGLLPNGDARAGILIPEGDAENLNLASTANGESTLKPVPPRPDKLNPFMKPRLPHDYHSQSLAKYSMQLHGYPQRHR